MPQDTLVDLIPFNFNGSEVRVYVGPATGQPWFVGIDVASQLGYLNPRDALLRHVETEDRKDGVGVPDAIGRRQPTTMINESGLYSLIFGSQLPGAKDFKRWVTSEVLPEIRKTGSYSQQSLSPAEFLLHQAQMMVAQERRTAALEAQQREHREQIEDLMGEQGVHRAQIEDLMGEQGVHRAEIDTLKENHDRVAAIGYANLRKIRSDVDFLRRLGVRAAAIARRDGLPVSRAHSTVWGEVNVWPLAVWDEAYRDVTGRDPR